MKVKAYLCVGLCASRTPCIKRLPNRSSCQVHSQFQKDSCYAGACHFISAICSEGSLCSVGKTLSLIRLALQLFYEKKQVLFPWNKVNLHLKIECFLSWGWNFSLFFFFPRIVKRFVVIYELVSKCLLHAVAHCLGLKCQWCLLKTHPVIAAACWSFRLKWWWSGSRETFM